MRDKQRNIIRLYELSDYFVDEDPIYRGIIKGVYTPFALHTPYRLVGANEKTKQKYMEYYERIHLHDRMRSIYLQYFKYGNVFVYLMEDGNLITLPVHLVRIANVTCYMGHTNTDYKTGASLTEYFSRSGTAPSGSATINSATLYLSSIKTYSAKGTYLTISGLGTSGVLSLNESAHSETVSFSPSGSILSFSGGSVSISLNTQQSTSANLVNFRDGCVLTITVNYTESATVSTATVSPTSVQAGSAISLISITAGSGKYHTATWT